MTWKRRGFKDRFRLLLPARCLFLPGASEDDCKAHYLAERGSRQDYETVIREFNSRAL
ncbi:hypothetical protein BDW62DRAFT_188597 [Aspergillus aurantiobrunneus]